MADDPIVEDATKSTVKGCWEALLAQKEELGLRKLEIRPVQDFLVEAPVKNVSRAKRELILDQAEILFRDLYCHRPFKEKKYPDARPLEKLAAIRQKLDEGLSDTDFHLSVLRAFACVRDSHTVYGMPHPFRGAVAFLPFELRGYMNGKPELKFVVTRVMEGFEHAHFKPGAEVVTFEGGPVETQAAIAADQQPGANPAAMLSHGASLLTLRPLGSAGWKVNRAMKAMSHSEVSYIAPGESGVRAIRLPWGVLTGFRGKSDLIRKSLSMNDSLDCSLAAGKALMCHALIKYEQWTRRADIRAIPHGPTAPIMSKKPAIFQIQHTRGLQHEAVPEPRDLFDPDYPQKRFGYVRIRKFFGINSFDSDELPDEFGRILARLNHVAPDGLILDIRGNPGGDIEAAERMLQMLTPHKITPCRFHFARTPAILNVIKRLEKNKRRLDKVTADESLRIENAITEFTAWLDERSRKAGKRQRLTVGQPLTERSSANDVGQVYKGPVVLLVDARTYSAADIFAAGFQDHEIGPIVGVDPNTGGGGANVWSHTELIDNVPSGSLMGLQPLPTGLMMSVAIRRARRIGRSKGVDIEDRGVKADVIHPVTLPDLMTGNRSVVQSCRAFLAGHDKFPMEISALRVGPEAINVTVKCATDIERVTFTVDDQLADEREVGPSSEVSVVLARTQTARSARQMSIHGYRDTGQVVAFRNVDLRAKLTTTSAAAGAS